MANFLTDLVKPYVEKLINGAIAESSYICCFTCIAKDFEEERARLEIERSTVKQRVDVATRRGEDVQGNARFWEEEADKLIQEDTKTKQKCLFGICPHIIWRYKRGKELANKKEQIKRLIVTGKELSIGLPARLPDVERYSSQHYIPFKSRESKYNELLDALKDDNNYVIGLKGMGGTGKTTLAKEVGKELKKSKQFTYVIDTTVSLSPNIRMIQDEIAGPLGLKFDECTESDRPRTLWSRLTNGEKILLILDDVWVVIDFDEIGIPDSDNRKGCRILVTTRNLLVCNKLGCSKTIQLDLLSEEDAWIMFQRHAGLSNISPKNLLQKGRKIANECKRLPVAIAAIASSLKGTQRQVEWEVALNSLQKHMSMHDVDDEFLQIYKCLQVSYDNMKNEMAKRLFLLCSVFREDEEISIERLTRLGIGGGLFGEEYGSYKDARSQVIKFTYKLLDSCLLLEANHIRVKMHDLVRDAAQWIANKEIQTVKLYNKNQKAMVERETNIKYLLCEGKLKDLFSFKLGGSKLEILIVTVHKDEDCHNVKIEVPKSLFENNTGLRVFQLIFDYKFSYLALSLPHSIQLLKNIRSLLFEHVDLGDISILGNLQSLETLDLYQCKIDELTHGITKLEKFRLLNLEFCVIARNNPFEVIEGCSSLEELYFKASFNEFCREITLPKLKRFFIHGTVFSLVDSSSLSKCVSLLRSKVFLSETTLKYCMQEAEVIRLRRIEGDWRNIIPEIVPMDQGMNDLVELQLRFISQLQFLVDTTHTDSQVPNVFSRLVVLTLYELENLEELCKGPISFDSLNCLENLSIQYCKRLQSLFKCNLNLFNLKRLSLRGCPTLIFIFQLTTARSLVLLETLEIINCKLLQNIIIDDGVDGRSCDTMFQKLKVLNIRRCPRIDIILPFLSAHDLPALESVTIKECDKVKYIFGQDVKLGLLETMELNRIPNLIDIFQECYGTMTSSISEDSSKQQAQSDPIKCKIFSWTDIYCCGKKYGHKSRSTTITKIPLVSESEEQSQDNLMESNSYCLNIWERAPQCLSRQPHILCNIKEIKLWGIKKIKSVSILSIAPRMLLESLRIVWCDGLKHIIIDTVDHDNTSGNNLGNVFPKLKELRVEDCRKLEYIIGHYTDDHQNHAEIHLHLPALEGLYLENLPSLVAMCPKQYHTTFPPLKKLDLSECPQFNIKPIGDFMTHHSVARLVDGTIIKELNGYVDHFLALERLVVNNNSKVEDIFFLNEINEQKMNLGLERIDLFPKNSIYLQNLTNLKIIRCERLKIVFSTSIIRCLPLLLYMRIEECKELKHVIEDELENKKSSNFMSTTKTCFPSLKTLVVVKCNKLKYVFPIFICKELPELKILMIREADELKEVFVSEGDDQKAEIQNLKFVVFVNLPSLCHVQGIQFQDVKNRFIQNCPKLSPASASTSDFEHDLSASDFCYDYESYWDVKDLFKQLHDESKGHDTCNEYPTSEITEVQATSGHKLSSSQKEMEQALETGHESVENVPRQEMPSVAKIPANSEELMNEQTMEQQLPLRETDASVEPSQENNLEGSTSEKNVASTLSTISVTTKNELPIQSSTSKQKGIEISVEEGTTSADAKTITSSPHSKEVGDGKICRPSFSIVNTKPPSTKDVDIGDSPETTHEFYDSANEDINKLIEEDPLLALEKLLTRAQSFSIGNSLQELKILMESSSDLTHLVSNQESKSKLISLFHGFNLHQGLLPSDVKEFVEKVQNFFMDSIIKHTTFQQVLKKHNQLLDSKTDLMNKLLSAKSIKNHIDSESSTANAQIHELSLQIDELGKKLEDLENQRDDLKSVVNKCDVEKNKLKAECSVWAQQSKELLSALASSEVDLREAEHARKLAAEDFANLKSLFPTF